VVYPENYEKDKNKEMQKEIENGILKAISDISNETDWPEEADAEDVQAIITQLARSVAHLRDTNTSVLEKTLNNKNHRSLEP
jgi:polyhydroxyalkanoate synthesis regulator phasin